MIEIHANFHILFYSTNFSLTLGPFFVIERYKGMIFNSDFNDFVSFVRFIESDPIKRTPNCFFLKIFMRNNMKEVYLITMINFSFDFIDVIASIVI